MRNKRRSLMRLNVPLALLFIVFVYCVLEMFLLDGSTLVCGALSILTVWSLSVATLSHPGKVRPNELGALPEGEETSIPTTSHSEGAQLVQVAPTDNSTSEAIGHFVPRRVSANENDSNTTDITNNAVKGTQFTGPYVTDQSNSTYPGRGLFSMAMAGLNAVPEFGRVTPTLSEASFATTQSSKSKLERKEDRKAEKERAKAEKRRQKELRHKKDPLYCRSCESRRPPRTHHCRVCDECVVRFDHHCIWIDNCIGASNMKAFYLFLIYIVLGILHYLISLISFVFSGHVAATIHGRPMGYFLAFLMVLYTPVVLWSAIIALSFLHSATISIIKNQTTYEQALEADSPHRYDRGNWFANCKEVMGDDVRLWWLPLLVKDKIHLLASRNAYDMV